MRPTMEVFATCLEALHAHQAWVFHPAALYGPVKGMSTAGSKSTLTEVEGPPFGGPLLCLDPPKGERVDSHRAQFGQMR